ncbi:MAG: hypothetical protein QOE70_6259 [Chthoniobacter sp.]|jgi:type I restriction enzyme R subunit|nr:hypothetical protein [Chthoniobacter sp.]
MSFNEAIVEEAVLEWFGELGYAAGHGPQILPVSSRRSGIRLGEVVLVGRLQR